MVARKAIEREPVVHHSVWIGFSHARHLFITLEQRLKSYFESHVFERLARFQTKFLGCTHTLAVQPEYFEVFDLVEHRHFCFAAPTPEPLHFPSIINVALLTAPRGKPT